jgi:hypothetical protein
VKAGNDWTASLNTNSLAREPLSQTVSESASAGAGQQHTGQRIPGPAALVLEVD